MTWAQAEFGAVKTGDARWDQRVVQVGAMAARRPSGKVTDVFRRSDARQGAYGLLESERVSPRSFMEGAAAACALRGSEFRYVIVPVDGSSLNLTDEAHAKGFGAVGSTRQGARELKVITALGLDPRGVPLGLLSQVWWARQNRSNGKRTRKTEQTETQRWLDCLREVDARLPGQKAWFQIDREGDSWPLLIDLLDGRHWFTIRANHDRNVWVHGRHTKLRAALAAAPVLGKYELSVPSGPNRTARTATLLYSALRVRLQMRDKRTDRLYFRDVSAIWVREWNPPVGEEPVDWLLLTNRDIATVPILDIVQAYAWRWRIEDFHKTWKSGACNVETSQLRSLPAMLKWATILATVAIRVERIKHLSREQPNQLASVEFSATELEALAHLRFGKKPPKTPLVHLTIGEATRWVADLGGYTGKSSGGPPGSTVIARGLRDLEVAVRVLDAVRRSD